MSSRVLLCNRRDTRTSAALEVALGCTFREKTTSQKLVLFHYPTLYHIVFLVFLKWICTALLCLSPLHVGQPVRASCEGVKITPYWRTLFSYRS